MLHLHLKRPIRIFNCLRKGNEMASKPKPAEITGKSGDTKTVHLVVGLESYSTQIGGV